MAGGESALSGRSSQRKRAPFNSLLDRIRSNPKAYALVLAGFIVLIAGLPRVMMPSYSLYPNGVDEGIQIMEGRMVWAGNRIYERVNTVQAPIMISLFGAFDVSPIAFRLLTAACSLVIFAIVMYAGYRVGGRNAMVATGAFLALDILFLEQSRFVSLDMYSLFWVVIGCALFLVYRSRRSRIALMLSGLVFGVSIMTKLFGVIAAGSLILLMFAERLCAVPVLGERLGRLLPGERLFRPRIREIGIFALSVVLSTLLIMSFFGIENVFQGAFLNQLHRPVDTVWVRFRTLGVFLLCNIVAIPFALGGIRKLYRHEEGIFILVGGAYLAFFIVQGKTWPHHLIFLSPILAISAGIGLMRFIGAGTRKGLFPARTRGLKVTRIALVSLLILAILEGGAFAFMLNQEGQPLDQSSASIVRSLSGPEDYIIVGDPMIARLAERPIPPNVVNIAFVQYPPITDDELNETAIQYGVTVVVITYRLLHMSGFREFVEGNYTLRAKLFDESSSLSDDYKLRMIYLLPEGSHLREHPQWGSALAPAVPDDG
jgi:hypothetical protein